MSIATDLQDPVPGAVKCRDCGRGILDSAMVYLLEDDGKLSPLCEECVGTRRRAAAARMAEAENGKIPK